MNKAELKALLAKDEPGRVIDILSGFAHQKQELTLINTLVMQQNRLHALQQKQRNGTASTEEIHLLRNQLLTHLMAIIDELPDDRVGATGGVSRDKVRAVLPRKAYLMAGIALLIVLLFFSLRTYLPVRNEMDPSQKNVLHEAPESEELPRVRIEGTPQVRFIQVGQEVVYTLLEAQLRDAGGGFYRLLLTVQCQNGQSYPINFWDQTFRLEIRESKEVLAPVSGLNMLVESKASQKGEIEFELQGLPSQTNLQLLGPEDKIRSISLVWE